jgi:DNA-binding transcriptional regulator YiaG
MQFIIKVLTTNRVCIMIEFVKEWAPEDIRALRQEMGLSQAAFAERLGVTRNFVYYLERGERKVNKTYRILLDCIAAKHGDLKGKESVKHGKRNL